MEPAGQLVVASDIRNTLFRRALSILDEVHAGLEDFNFCGLVDDSSAPSPRELWGNLSSSQTGATQAGALVLHKGGDPLERVLATFLQGRTSTARRAVGAVSQIHSEIDSILCSFERDFPPLSAGAGDNGRLQDVSVNAVTGQPSEEVLRMAAATTAAASRFRVRAAEAAKSALQVYDNAAKQATAAAQATTQALEMQILAEQHSVAGNLPQALDSIRQANRLRDESAEAARLSRQFQKEYARHRREAQEAHLQADAAMRHAYSLEREALKSSSEAALRQYAMCKERYERLARQADELRAQAVYLDAEADAAVARAGQAQHQANAEMAGGNYDLGNALMQEAVRSQEQAGYARAQAKAARDSLQRLMPDLQAAREHMEEAERHVEDLSQRQARLQDATTKQRTDRLHEEADELAALCAAAEGAASMHEDLVRAYEERLAEDRQLYGKLSSEGRTAEADALAVHITTWEELLDVARKNLHTSRAEANTMRKRLTELSKADVSTDPGAAIIEGAEDFQQLREAKDKESLAAQAVAIMARGLSSSSLPDATVDGAVPATDGLLLQTEMHRQRIARLAEQMDKERQRLEDGHALSNEDGQSGNTHAEALLDSMAVSHLVGTLETTRLLQLWKQRSEQAAASAAEMRKAWEKLEQDATAKASEAVRLEEQALALEQAGRSDEASSTMAQAGQLHRIAEHLRLDAEKAKSALLARETAADNAQAQSRSLVQGLYDVEYAAGRLQSELGRRGYTIGDGNALDAPSGQTGLEDASHRGTATDAPREVPPPAHEMATAMMNSPGMLSKVSNTITKKADLTGFIGMAGLHAYGVTSDGDAVTTRSGGATSAADVQGQMPPSRQPGQSEPAPLDGWFGGSAMRQTSTRQKDDTHHHDARFARLVRELETYAAIAAPDISVCRWEGHAGLILALQTDGNEDAILAISNDLTVLNDQLGNGAGLVEVQVQRDEQRTARWQALVAALQPGADALVAAVAERTLARCVAVASSSKVTEDALALQANCQDALLSGISSYRRALGNERTAVESVRSAQADLSSVQRQAQQAQALDAELLQQIRALQDQLAAADSQGSTAQTLAVRFELQRLQNKHMEAAARASQLISACIAAQQGADEARRKEADSKGSVQSLSRMVMTLADAAKEAAVGVHHAVDGYRYALSALVLGAKTDLTRLGSGGTYDVDPSGADAHVQTLFQRHADCISQAQQSREATLRLQQLADGGPTPVLSPVFSRATTNTSINASPTEEHGALASRRLEIGVIVEQPAIVRSTLPSVPSGSDGEQRALLGSWNPLLRPSVNGQSGPIGNGDRQLPFLADEPPATGSSNRLLRPSTGERPGPLGAINPQDPPSANDLPNSSNPLLKPYVGELSGPLGSEISLLRPSAGEQLGSRGSRNQVLRPSAILQSGSHGGGNQLLRPSSGLISAMQPSSHAQPSCPRKDLVVTCPITGAETDGPGELFGRRSDIADSSVAGSIGSGFGASSTQGQLSVQRLSGVKLSSEFMPVSRIADALAASSASSMPTSLPRASLLMDNARTGINHEAAGLSAFIPFTSTSGGLGAFVESKLQGNSLTPSGESQPPKQSTTNGPFGSFEVALPDRSLMASHPSTSFKVTNAIGPTGNPVPTEPQRSSADQVSASLTSVSNTELRSFADAAPSGQLCMSQNGLSMKPPGVMLSQATKAAIHEESDYIPGKSLELNNQMVPGAGTMFVGSCDAIKPATPSTRQVDLGSAPSLKSNSPAVLPDWQVPGQAGHGVEQDWGRNLARLELPTGMPVGPVVGVDRPSSRGIMAMEAELASLHARHQQQLTELSSPRRTMEGAAPGQDPSNMRRMLETELQQAEDQLRAARAQQEFIRDASPTELQASNDQLQCREQRVTMLEQALAACSGLANDRISLDHVLAEANLVDLEAQQCDETLVLLAKAAEMCSKAVRELHLQSLDVGDQASPDVRQSLAYVHGKAADIEHRQQQLKCDAKRFGEKRHKLKEQLAAQQAAMKLREDWMHQARKAAAAAADTMAWENRLASARTGLQRLAEPLHELQNRAEAASDAAQKMTSAATQHRKQAEDLAQQAMRQREDARSFAANGMRLDADAANSMADSLQQQADGLTAQAARMEEDAGKLFSEANELGVAAERARKRIVAQTEIVQQVSKAHQLSVDVLQWSCTAAFKLHDAVQKQAAAAEQQRAVDQVERELIEMEGQNTESIGGGSARPDELASHMIYTVRAKQEASRMRAALQAAQQQVDQDLDAASAAIRQAARAEEERMQLEPRIQELELQAQVNLHSDCNVPNERVLRATGDVAGYSSPYGGGKKSSHSTVADFSLNPARGSQLTASSGSQYLLPSNSGPQTGDMVGLGFHVTSHAQFPRQLGDPSGGVRGNEPSGLTAKVQLSGVTRTGTVGQESQPQQVRIALQLARMDRGKSGGGTSDSIPSEPSRNQSAKRAASPTALTSTGEVGSPAVNGGVTPDKWRIAVGAANAARTFTASTPPPARLILGSSQPQRAVSCASSPTGSVVGVAGAHIDWSPRDHTRMHTSKPRIPLQQDDRHSERSYGHTTTPAAVDGTQVRPNRFFQSMAQREDSGPVTGLHRIGATRNPDRSPGRNDEVSAGTAGALLDKVANKSLKPLSHVKILNAAGKPVAQPYQNRDSTSSFESGTGGTSVTRGVVRTGSVRSSADSHADGNHPKALASSLDEELQMEDDGSEPDSKMYRTMKQRAADLEGRITELRRQGDTARTATEILSQKQEQRRIDMPAAVDMDQALQNALLEHGDAMIRMKQADSVLCHRRADFLEEELAVCRDALQYAIVDWHFRREMKRLDERCAALTDRAQSLTLEAQGFDAEVGDASECIMLATSKAGRGAKTYAATLEQQQIARFIEEQQERLKMAGMRAAESRSEAAQITNIAKGGASRKLLVEKKALCNKALYQSAVELADAYDHAAKIVAKAQHVKQHGMKAMADVYAERVQQLEAEIAAKQEQNATSSAAPSKLRGSQPVAIHPAKQGEEVLGAITRLSSEVEEAIQQCLQEITGEASDVLNVHRRRMEQICALVRLYQASHDDSDHMVDEMAAAETATLQPPSEATKRPALITAAQDAVHYLDRACGVASQLRALSLDAVEAHAAMFDLRADPAAIRVQLLGLKAATEDIDREEIDVRKQRLALLEIEIPLARDQLTATLQVLEYRQAAAQLSEAQKELQDAATVAAEAVVNLESMITVRRENIAIMHRHINAIFQEARIFAANGNVLQAAAAEEAAQRLSKESLAAETSLAALVQESHLKRDEQLLARAAAEELQQVADGSLELVGILLRVVSLQQEARAVSSRINELDGEQLRLEQECASRQSLADQANKQAEQLQHESLQCRTNLKFSAADTHLNESRQYRISAQEHVNAAETAKQAADAAAQQHKNFCQRRKQLLCEVHLLHTAAGHLQGALSCMRDKHHLVRKLRDVEYQCRNRQQAMEPVRSSTSGPVREIDVLRTQVDASTATIKHHLASKTSYVTAADNLHLAAASFDRQAACALQADAAMQDITQARVAAAITTARGSMALSVPLLTDGRSSGGGSGDTVTVQAAGSELALVQPGKHEETSSPVLGSAPSDAELVNLQLQQAELRYRCLRGSMKVLETIAAAAEHASEARCRQVELSDQAAALVSDLAAKILEAEACANEAASLEAAVRANAALLDEDDEENVKVKLMLNALLQKAESYRNEALLLQGRIKELEEQECAAGAKAAGMEESLIRLRADHRHALDALDLAERISQGREQEAAARAQMQTLAAEVAQLEREAKNMGNKIAQLRQQLTSASHTACSEDVANVMLVMQQIDSKLALHRQLLQQRRLELDSSREECERLSVGITFMKQRAEHVLHAGETQEQVRQTVIRVGELQSDLFSAQASRSQCEHMLDELRQQYAQLGTVEGPDTPLSEAEGPTSPVKVRHSQQMAATQVAIALAEQMLETHTQRVEVLQAAVTAWESARQRQEALLRHQEQLMQQDSWRATLEQHRAELRKAAVGHAEKALQLRATADKSSSGAALLLTVDPDAAKHPNDNGPGGEALSIIRAQAATIKVASEAAEQHGRAEAEDALGVRAAALAQGIDREIRCFSAASSLVQPMLERLYLAASASVSVARLQLACVCICSDQGNELSTMHEALTAVRGFAARIQGLLEVADRRTRAGQNMEAAAARGQATAVQDALQQELNAVRLCKHRLMELGLKMEGAKHELRLADKRMAQVTRSAAATQSVTEYVHRACELRYECGERQWGTLQVLRRAADAAERVEVARRAVKASQEAERQLTQAGKRDKATILGRTVTVLKRSLMEAEAQRRLADAQAVQDANTCGSEVAAAGLYMELAEMTVKLLWHVDEMDMHHEEHEQLQESLETARRSHQASQALLHHRRGEMQNLTQQIETHRCESQLLRKMGNEAQAIVRQEATNMLTSQLAEIAEDVMKLERRCECLHQNQTLLSSLNAKSESRMGLLGHLARLCSAAVGHLLDARDAHDNHSIHIREAAVAAVELSKEEEALSTAEARVRELRDSLERLICEKTAVDREGADHGNLQREINLAEAELQLAHRRRGEAEQQVLAIRARVAQAELAEQSSQLRVTKARQRAEDAQKLADNIRMLLNGSSALAIDLSALQRAFGTATDVPQVSEHSLMINTQVIGTSDPSHPHGVLAAAQLHSVTLQALTEAASKFMQALDCAAAAEQRRSEALLSTQAAQAAREAAERQRAVLEELRAIAEGINMVQHAQQLTGGRNGCGDNRIVSNGGDRNANMRAKSAGGQPLLLHASSVEQDTAAIAELELERLQHEAAYREADAAQEGKLAACFLRQQELLRLASESLLEMARFGVAAELNAGPNMTADEASSLLVACKQLAEQHVTTLMLGPALDRCKHAEDYLKASLQYIQEAKKLRDKVIGDRLSVLQDRKALYLKESDPVLRALMNSSRSPRDISATGYCGPPNSAMLPPGPAEDDAAKTQARLAGYDQLLMDEERMLMQVQELDKAASEFIEESGSQATAFTTRWSDVIRQVRGTHRLQRVQLMSDPCCRTVRSVVSKDGATPEADTKAQLCKHIASDAPIGLLMSTALPSSTDIQSQGSKSLAFSTVPDGFTGELSLKLIGPVTDLGEDSGQGRASSIHQSTQSVSSARPRANTPKEKSGGGPIDLKLPNVGTGNCEIDVDLVAMAAATVARAKAAAAALAVKASSALEGGQLVEQQRTEAPARAASEPGRAGKSSTHWHTELPLLSAGKSAHVGNHRALRQPRTPGPRGAAATHGVQEPPGATAAAALDEEAPVLGINNHGCVSARPDLGEESSQDTLSSSWLLLPSGNAVKESLCDSFSSAGGAQYQDAPGHTPVALQPAKPADALADFTPRLSPAARQCSTTVQSLSHLAATSQDQDPTTLQQLPRVLLPDDLDPATAVILQDFWSMAALHYQRAQQMHDCALQQVERQWQRCQAQVQMLQTEELKARTGGRLSEADGVMAARAKWQHRAAHLDTEMQCHRQEILRHKALLHRATIMVERLQLMAAAATAHGFTPAIAATLQHDEVSRQQLLPRFPGIMLAGCGILQPLERLHGELVQQAAALHATVAGLQQQSQRLFGKAARRSSKLKVKLGGNENTAAHALALAKSQSAAEQSAALGERAVELAAHARMVQELADQLSGEGANCLHILERLQHACDKELQAHQALLLAADLLLCEATQAVLRGERGADLFEPMRRLKPDVADLNVLAQLDSQSGSFDKLLEARHPPGACLSAAQVQAQRGEDMAQDAVRVVQSAKEQLELQMGLFTRRMDEAAAALSAVASARSSQCDALRAQADAAAMCVARARSKLAAQRTTHETVAAQKYGRAAEGWAKQAEKLRKEVLVTSAAAEEIGSRGLALASLGQRLRPIQAALDRYLDKQLEAWATAALLRI